MSEIDSPTRVKRKALLEKLSDKERLSDIGAVMSTIEGRRVMNDLLRRCGVGRLSFAGPGQAEQTAFYEGQRNIGNYYWAVLTKNFKKEWLLMTEEYDKRQEAANGDRNSNGRGEGNNHPDGEGEGSSG